MKKSIQSLTVKILLVISYIFASLCTFNFLFVLCEIIGGFVSGSPDCAVKDLTRVLPFFFVFICSILFVCLVHKVKRNAGTEQRRKSMVRFALGLIVLSFLAVCYVMMGLFTGMYESMVVGFPSALYPLDSVIISGVFILISVFILIYVNKIEEKCPFELPVGVNSKKSKWGFVYGIFAVVWLLCGGYGFTAVIFSPFMVEWMTGHIFYPVVLLCMLALPTVYLFFSEFVFDGMTEEKKPKLRKLSLCGMILSALVSALYCVAYFADPMAPALTGMGILVIDFTATVNASTFLYIACNLAIPVTAFIMSFTKKYDK